MFKNFIRTSLRHLLKNKTFGLVNILGLAIGILCCLYIVLYVMDQYSYDKHHKDAKDIYRVVSDLLLTGDRHHMATCSPPVAPAMKRDFAEVRQFTRVIPTMGVKTHLLTYKDKTFYEKDAYMVDSTFFDVFTYHFVNGNPAAAFTHPYSIVLLQPVAEKLFGKENPVGKTLEMNDDWGKKTFTVTAVVDESLGKSHINAGIFMCLNGAYEEFRENNTWTGNNFTYSYVKLQPGASAGVLEKKLPAFLLHYAADDLKRRGMQKQIHLQPIGDIHTESGYQVDASKTVNSAFLHLLLLIAGLIQLIACINFMNLSTARASRRAKEVGVRKVIGAGRGSLVLQFLSESFTLSLAGVLIALPLLSLFLPYLNQITRTDISLAFLKDIRIWLTLAGIVLVTGVVAGSYPAFYLSAFNAVKVIKGNFTNHISAAAIRRGLVVFQFVISITLITGIIVIYSQLNYIKGKDLGFGKDQQLIFHFPTQEAQRRIDAFMNDIRSLPEVHAVSKTDNYPGQPTYHNWGVWLAGGDLSTSVNQSNINTDEHFIDAMQISLVSGRNFHLHDSDKVIINETLARRLGMTPENAVGVRLFTSDSSQVLKVAGVVKDFNFQSLHDEIRPFMLMYRPHAEDLTHVIAGTDSRNYKVLLGQLEAIWHKEVPGYPFDYEFYDDMVQKQYETELNLSRIINSFTLVAIFISCLGLFGLAAFNAEQRRKEISIRKVLGAGIPNIVQLQSKEFFRLVIISFLLATPIAWWILHKWLQNFAYQIKLSWWMFGTAGLVAIVITLSTISYQAIRTAIANPLKGLRSE
ncbi:ABC transporter permease [Flavitalea sp. BT771]|uniref:ABC transporter permease n=1 Tax=Flavitalea sp. BT771 TaxID=3063329 RepID=UPI0026E30D80|nr:ABC transporter permease [Flavitalea sp. BT771]MDO6429179.1 ABC transporter permease [Flavitalea sp. BT771]MDV6218693.1 ABC transporter permease [Flavitalea sp. BT771]